MTPEVENIAPPAKRVSVVIVSLNRARQLRQLLEGLGEAHQIVVVDNGSTDGAVDLEPLFPAARFVRLPRNFGLTKALNLGAWDVLAKPFDRTEVIRCIKSGWQHWHDRIRMRTSALKSIAAAV